MPRHPKHDHDSLPMRRPAETGGGMVGAAATYAALTESGVDPILAGVLAALALAVPFVISELVDRRDGLR